MRCEYKTTHFSSGDAPALSVGHKDKDDWELVFQHTSEDGLMTMWLRERRPMGSVIREARDDG